MARLIFNDKKALAMDFSVMLKELINKNSKTDIALSGGSTPKALFDYISEHHSKDIKWEKLHLYWGDERCVPPNDSESNYKMTFDHLLKNIDIPHGNIHRIKGENNPEYEAKRYSKVLDKYLDKHDHLPQFDLVILGMGDDGHTASIFPHEIHLWNSRKLCVVAVHPETGQKRISLTGKVINNAKSVAFLVTGSNKRNRIAELFTKADNATSYPASLVRPKSKDLIWYLDKDAAEMII